MKNKICLALLFVFVALCPSCAIRFGKHGFSAVPMQPPKDAVVSITVRSIGIAVGQNQATQTPEATIGYKSVTYNRVPTGTNVTVPRVSAKIGVKAGLANPGIDDSFETGEEKSPAQEVGKIIFSQ